MQKNIISASILSADFAHLASEVKNVLAAGVDDIHFDVMDNHFVPNLSFGAVVCKALRKAGIDAAIDVHLMVENPESFIEPFAKAGASLLTFHPETVSDVKATLQKIQEAGMKTGLAFNPEKSLDVDDQTLEQIDLLLIMSVNPGFGGQSFLPASLNKIESARKRLNGLNSRALLGVDGGIKASNIGEVARAGADFFVVGSGLFHSKDYRAEVDRMREAIEQ